MNLIELRAIKGHLHGQLAQVNAIPVNCQSCTQFSTSMCGQYKAPPPPDWIHGTVECEFWDWDGVPF